MKKVVALALMAGIAFAVNAKDSVGYLSIAQGNVSVGGEGFATHAKHGMLLVDGNTVTVPTNGVATVVFNNGCSVPLKGSQFFTVNSKLSCSQLQASVTQMFDSHRVAQAPVGGGAATGGGVAGGASRLGVLGGMGVVSIAGFAAVKNDEHASGS